MKKIKYRSIRMLSAVLLCGVALTASACTSDAGDDSLSTKAMGDDLLKTGTEMTQDVIFPDSACTSDQEDDTFSMEVRSEELTQTETETIQEDNPPATISVAPEILELVTAKIHTCIDSDTYCTWTEDTVIGEVVSLYTPTDVCNGYVFKFQTNDVYAGYMQVNLTKEEPEIMCYSYKGLSAIAVLAGDKDIYANSCDGKLYFFGNFDYGVKVDDSNFQPLNSCESITMEEAVAYYTSYVEAVTQQRYSEGSSSEIEYDG